MTALNDTEGNNACGKRERERRSRNVRGNAKIFSSLEGCKQARGNPVWL